MTTKTTPAATEPKFLVALGDAFSGITFYGPFDEFQEADDYGDSNSEDGDYHVMSVTVPVWNRAIVEPESDGGYAVAVGHITAGLIMHGPFADYDTAERYADSDDGGTVVELNEPKE